MNKSPYLDQQKAAWVKAKLQRAKSVKEICAEANISRKTLHNWQKKFELIPPRVSKSSQPSSAFVELQKLKIAHNRLISSIRTIDDVEFKNKLISRLVNNYSITLDEAASIAGLNIEECNYQPRKNKVDDNTVKSALCNLMKERKAFSLSDCYSAIKVNHPEWTKNQIRRVFREQKEELEVCKKNAKEIDKFQPVNSEPVTIWIVLFFYFSGSTFELPRKASSSYKSIGNKQALIAVYNYDNPDYLAPIVLKLLQNPTEKNIGIILDEVKTNFGRPSNIHFHPLSLQYLKKWKVQNKVPVTTIKKDLINTLKSKLTSQLILRDNETAESLQENIDRIFS